MHQISIPEQAIERGRIMRPAPSINPATTAVIAIDFQRFFIDEDQPMGNAHARDVLEHANRLHAALRDAGGLVVFTQHSIAAPDECTDDAVSTQTLAPGSVSYELHPDIAVDARDWKIVKRQSSPLHPCADTELNELLRDRGIDTVIISGLVTNGCCDCTARDAFQYGYQVFIATDATAAMSDEEHNAALLNLVLYYAEAMSVNAIVDAVK